MHRFSSSLRSKPALAFAAAFSLTMILSPGRAQLGPSESWTAPRTADDHPDLQGFWSNAVLTPLERPTEFGNKAYLTEEEAREYERQRLEQRNMDQRSEDSSADLSGAYNDFWWDWGDGIAVTRQTSLIIDPPDGQIPELTAEGKRRAAARAERRRLHPADGPEDLRPQDRCINWPSAGPPMLPTAYNNNYQIVQTADYVLIVNEMVHDTRIVPLDGRAALPGHLRQWLGRSRGRWEGDTLVVETTNFTDQTNFRGASENMHLTERFTRVADDVLIYEFTVDDSAAFTQPWTARIPSVKADGLIYEYACHEGNRSMIGILAGARAEERAQAEE